METSDTVRHYADDAIEISDDAHRCIHAAECIGGLPAVFDDQRRPWIVPSAGSADEIATVIAKCPSGALHFKRRDGGPAEIPEQPATIVPTAGGPYYVRGRIQIRPADGSSVFEDVRMALCAAANPTIRRSAITANLQPASMILARLRHLARKPKTRDDVFA